MAATTTTGFLIPASAQAVSTAGTRPRRRRRITPEAGHALEILGHAIEYLTDEFVYAGGSFSARDPQVEAVQLLMSLNRKVYFECPEVPGFAERLRALMRPRTA